ncbi:MAG TPA: formate dehydrogenase accessory sulfurtransferase FdhD [Bosea sp. (in: a-proteobacteria)]|jgi:FdhD protein|uniref:formate dehydrogenase accessory sulfurtransferase FdhD n=1 Tax=Bosea sp. (in: a-proteobacteria) TaxID=1871050 RepID=UPI002DDD2A18|nr:formate dehydrogenase accessory sulfurtransferase FdhD [Bosea sp. (in: a-proteobacteria)]HEV2556382.1 formate dehydrogenase accessory sulfurtransferase FdhD [Bosea sp. (in: a-proteobacteria)]
MPRNSAPAQPPASCAVGATPVRFACGAGEAGSVEVAVEAAVNIVYGNQPYAVMMATPSDLEDFVTGFSLTEGIICDPTEIRGISVAPQAGGLIATVDLAPGRFREHLARRRNLSGRTSCGLCGVETLAQLPMAAGRRDDQPGIAAAAIATALSALDRHQPLHRLTRAVHAAAWCDVQGRILAVREDVGRHNALDKLIGARLRAGQTAGEGFLLVTSRASFEMVEKTAIFGAGTLVSISAPTSLAIERAVALRLTLVSVARDDGCTIFAGSLTSSLELAAR